MRLMKKRCMTILCAAMMLFPAPAGAGAADVKPQPTPRASVERVTDSEVAALMEGQVLFYDKSNKALCDNQVLRIDENAPEIKPYFSNQTAMVPFVFFCKSFGAELTSREDGTAFDVLLGDHSITLKAGNGSYTANGAAAEFSHPPQMKNGVLFAPLTEIAAALGMSAFTDDSGYMLAGDRADALSLSTFRGRRVMYHALRPLIFDRPTAEQIVADVAAKNPGQAHPRLIVTDERLQEIKDLAQTDAHMKTWLASFFDTADRMLTQPLLSYNYNNTDAIPYLYTIREALRRMEYLPLAYRLTGRPEYRDRAKQELLNICSDTFEHWNPVTLHTAEMCAAVALGYDWLYNELTEEERLRIRTAIINKAMIPAMDDYNLVPKYRNYHLWMSPDDLATPNNWSAVCNGGLAMAALAICDEAPDPAAQVLERGLGVIEDLLGMYGPDGSYYEGLNYWFYSLQYLSYYSSSLTTAAGTDYGLFDAPGLERTAYYMDNMSGACGVFNLKNVDTDSVVNDYPSFYIADRVDDPMITALRLYRMEKYSLAPTVEDLFWYKPTESVYVRSGQDAYYREEEVALMRTGNNDEADIFVGMHGSDDNKLAGQMDAGSFVLDALGERWAYDSGTDMGVYVQGSATEARNNNYRSRAEGHNTFIIDPDYGVDQDRYVAAPINIFRSNINYCYAICDLTEVYAFTGVQSAVRGIMLDKRNQHIVIRDEVRRETPMELYWFMHTEADIEISADGTSAVLTKGGKRLHAAIISEGGYVFTELPAAPLPSSPQSAGNPDEAGKRKLAVRASGVSQWSLSVCLTPLAGDETAPAHLPDNLPLSQWNFAEEENRPFLNSIAVNGKNMDGFSPGINLYAVSVTQDYRTPALTASGSGDVTIVQPDSISQTGKITLRNQSGQTNTYLICFVPEPTFTGVPGSPCTAAEPYALAMQKNAEGMEVYTTGWNTAAEKTVIDYDFRLPDNTLDMMSLHVPDDGANEYELVVLTSNDRKNWTPVFRGRTYQNVSGLQGFRLKKTYARYVRLIGCGVKKEHQFAPNEVRFYTRAGDK